MIPLKSPPTFLEVVHAGGARVMINIAHIIMATDNNNGTLTLVIKVPPHNDSQFTNTFYCSPAPGISTSEFMNMLKEL